MPNPVPLATKEEEDRRSWVTAHHEVVRLVKDCFGDRFSNNEIFDRLKISRRTGYRALGNDERIGKAPGRKPKITEDTIRDMIKYIEDGGCSDVGNVWKHLAEKFAPDCNPKTVQDAVKKSGFKNYHNEIKLDPLLSQPIPDNQLTPNEEAHERELEAAQTERTLTTTTTHVASTQVHVQVAQHEQPGSVIDPAFHQASAPDEVLRHAISTAPPEHIRWMLTEVVLRYPDAANLASAYLCPFASHAPVAATVPGMAGSTHIQTFQIAQANAEPSKRRLAICRRCGQQYDRATNTMDTRECLYHKGSPQKISNDPDVATIDASPEAYIWSCCGGNGMVRGCFRAMHTTKKKRRYAKKRDASDAGLLLDDDASAPEDAGLLAVPGPALAHLPALEAPVVDAVGAAEYSQGAARDGALQVEARMQAELQRGMQREFTVEATVEASLEMHAASVA